MQGILEVKEKPKRRFGIKGRSHILEDDREIVEILQLLKEDLTYVHHCLDLTTDPILIDSYIYEIQAIHLRYQFYMQQCKERGLTGYAY